MATNLDSQLLTPEFRADPYALYHQLRSEDPVHWSDAWDCWIMTRYDDVNAALRDPRRFSSVGTMERYLKQLQPSALRQLQPLYDHFTSGLTRLDPPEHTRLRSLANSAFTRPVIEELRTQIQFTVEGLIDNFENRGQVDLISEFAYPLPASVIADLFGLPMEDCDRFKAWSQQIVAFHGTGRADPVVTLRSQEALLEAREWLGSLVDERRQCPQKDLLTRFVQAEEQGENMSTTELFSNSMTFIIGGHETTTNLIGNGVLALLQNPDQLSLLQQDPGLIEQAIEEMLRYDAPTQRAHHIATRDIDLHGNTIRKGDFVQPIIAAANRDPEQFPDPDRFDIQRLNNKHLSFGAGPHYCIGAPLSRMEAKIAIPALIRRLPNLELDPDEVPEMSPNNFFRGRVRLPLVFGR